MCTEQKICNKTKIFTPAAPLLFLTRSFLLLLLASALILPAFAARAFGADAPAEQKSGEQAVAKLDEKVAAAEDILKKKEAAVSQINQEAEQAIAEKNEIAQEAKLKGEAAALAKEQAQLLKQEATVKKDQELLKKAKELEKKAARLEKEAGAYSDRVAIAESKTQIALEQIAARRERIENLEKALETLKKERAGKLPLLNKLAESLTILLTALSLLIFFKYLLKFFAKRMVKKAETLSRETSLRIKTFGKIFTWAIGVLIIITAVFLILETFGVSVAPLLAGAGIVGLAFGFGGQYLIRDIIGGFFILIEGQYMIDDVIKVGEYSGLVEDINLRITTLRDLEGRVIIIPNGEIKGVINYTKGYAHALIDLGIAYKENVDKVIEVIKELGRQMREDPYYGKLILADLEMFGVDEFGDSAVIIKFRIKTLPMKQWDVSREFKRRLKNRFDELGIEIPFPHRMVYWGAPLNTAGLKDAK